MEELYKASAEVDTAEDAQDLCSTEETDSHTLTLGKLEGEAAAVTTGEPWPAGAPQTPKRSLSPLLTLPTSESPAVALKLLQPLCLGDASVVLPILTAPPAAPGVPAAPYLMSGQGPVSIPLVLEPQVLQHALLQQTAACPGLALQSSVLCPNPSLSLGAPPALDQKGPGAGLDTGLLTLLQNPSFAAILQDLFPGTPVSACPPPSPPQIDLSSTFLPPQLPYNTPLAPLVPPATLLVPYPVVIPLPVPLPIPVPIPIPVSISKAEAESPKPACTLSKSTQTPPSDGALYLDSRDTAGVQQPVPVPLNSADMEVLDLSTKLPRPSAQAPAPQVLQHDSVLDLSLPSVRKTCIQSRSPFGPLSPERDRLCHLGEGISTGALALGVLRPVDCTPKLDSKLLSGLASLEFSRQHKWVVDSSVAGSGSVHDSALTAGGNIEIVSTSQTAKVIVSVKDAMPAIFCSKIKGLSGVSTKNFSIKCDGGQGAFATLPRGPGDPRGEPSDTLKKISKNRGIKLKKVSSQEIHILPIKKQRLAAFIPRK